MRTFSGSVGNIFRSCSCSGGATPQTELVKLLRRMPYQLALAAQHHDLKTWREAEGILSFLLAPREGFAEDWLATAFP